MGKSYEEEFSDALDDTIEEARKIGRGEPAGRLVVWAPPSEIDVVAIRVAQGLTQAQFAAKWGFSLSGLKKWELGLRKPEGPIRTLLVLISLEPETVERLMLTTRPKPARRRTARAKKAAA